MEAKAAVTGNYPPSFDHLSFQMISCNGNQRAWFLGSLLLSEPCNDLLLGAQSNITHRAGVATKAEPSNARLQGLGRCTRFGKQVRGVLFSWC
jgi:hypothetical protein